MLRGKLGRLHLTLPCRYQYLEVPHVRGVKVPCQSSPPQYPGAVPYSTCSNARGGIMECFWVPGLAESNHLYNTVHYSIVVQDLGLLVEVR